MALVVATLGVILSGFIALSTGKDTCDMYAAVGQVLTLPLDYKPLAKTDELRWTHNKTIIFYRQAGRVLVGKPEDVTAAGSLQVKGLKFPSAGIYEAHVLNNSGTLIKQWTVQLCMMEKVSKPQVKFACDSKANIVTCTCYVATPQGLIFTWALNDKALTGETKDTLRISLTQLKGENNFTCSVANKVSKEMSNSIRLKCVRSEPAPPTLLCFGLKTVVATLAGGGCLILLVITLIITTMVCGCRRRHKTLMSLEDAGEIQIVPLTKQHQQPVSVGPEYESMHHIESPSTPSPKAVSQAGTPAQDEPLQIPSTNQGEKPSPVPKPRTKTPQTLVK